MNGPFNLDSDRSKLIDSDWNGWLSVQAARLAADLITGDWFKLFGADAYLAINPGVGRPDQFAEAIREHLGNDACWPTRARNGRSPLFANARDIVVAAHPTLDGYLSNEVYFDDRFAVHSDAIDMALKFGAKQFSLNSLVRLHCAPEDSSGLATNTGPDANFHYSDYEGFISGEDLQVRFAKALGYQFRRLSNQNRKDLKTTVSTLAADGSLQAAERLVRVEPSIWNACPVTESRRLHPKLLNHKKIADLCKPFDVNTWIRELADQAADGEIDRDDQETLYSYLLNNSATINRTTLSTIKRSPVVKDHRGNWVSPNQLVRLPKWQFDKMEPVVSAPPRELIRASSLLKRLQVRQKLRGEDLVVMAEHVVDHPERAEEFEQLLNQQFPLLIRKTVQRLRSIAFLSSRAGTLARPEELYLATSVHETCLDDAALFVAGTNRTLYQKLKCRAHPASETLLNSLEQRRVQGQALNRPDVFYPALVVALRNEGLAPWFGNQRTEGEKTLGKEDRRALKDAYQRLGRGGLPDRLDGIQCLLSEGGTLHSLCDLREGKYLENDYPELADALREAGTKIAFADIESNTIAFFQRIGLQKLSQACGEHCHDVGEECEPPTWFQSQCERALKRIGKGEFAAALADLAWSHYHNNGGFQPADGKLLERRLINIEDISCVTSIRRVHRLAGIEVSVPSEAGMMGNCIAMPRPKERPDFDLMLAFGLAEAAGASRISDMRTFSNYIFALLQCCSKTGMSSYLKTPGYSARKVVGWR